MTTKINAEVETTVVKTTRINLDTEDIEEIIRQYYGMPKAMFDWHIGQWVSLTLTSREEEKL